MVWRGFELDPSTPRVVDTSVDYVERLARKYRATPAAAQGMIDRMVQVGAADGLDFRFDRVKPVNTFDAHRLLHWALAHGRQDALKERLFRAYMHEGRSVSDHEELVAIAVEVGLSADGAQAVLSSDDHAQAVRSDQALAVELGITGVPFFVIAGRYAVSGAQPAEVLLQALERAWADLPPEQREATAAEVCGPDGCAVP